MKNISITEISNFLKEFNNLITSGKLFILGGRKKNHDALIELSLTETIRNECLMNLCPEDYCNGPVPDENGNGEIWIFGLEIDCQQIYIKIKISETTAGKIAKCLSFHKAERKMNYPFKNCRG